MTAPSLVIGTAGHIDHGKTSLVRSLTGVDLDRLPEEQERGITIALGATPLDLPDGRRAGLIDVPGHERLVRTMVSGATGIDAALLCVSAVDGAMPQTREHLAILDLLGVRQGAIVLTMSDLVDEEMLELAIEDVRDAVEGTFLAQAPVIPFSAVDGTGRDDVMAAIAAFTDTERSDDGPFRLPIDRTFSRPGFGTIVTGTVWSGTLRDGDTVRLLPGDIEARVRGIEVHGEKVDAAPAGRRAAVNLAGIDSDDVQRGLVVSKGPVVCASMIDARYHHLADAPPLADGVTVRVLLGTAERLARMVIAEEPSPAHVGEEIRPGATQWVQLRLESPIPCLPGDRFVIRRPSPEVTLGGGQVIDPWAPRLRRRDRERVAKELARLAEGADVVWLERAGEEGIPPDAWAARSSVEIGIRLGDRWFAPVVVARLQGVLLEALAAYHEAHALSLGAQRRELRRGRLAHLPDRVFDALLDQLASNGQVVVDGPVVRMVGFEVELSSDQTALEEQILEGIRQAGLSGRTLKELLASHGGSDVQALLKLMRSRGAIEEVASVGWVDAELLRGLEEQIRSWFDEHDALAPSDFKALTGLTRKAAIPLLEWLDGRRITQRAGDGRGPGSALRSSP